MSTLESVITSLSLNSFFGILSVQLICVSFIYIRAKGKGLYWSILLAAALCGFIGIVLSSLAEIFIQIENNLYNKKTDLIYLLFIFAEPFWIVLELSIVICNYIKLSVLLPVGTKLKLLLRCIFCFGSIGFSTARVYIGISRYTRKVIDDSYIWRLHFIAWIFLFSMEFSFSIWIAILCSKHKKKTNNGTSLSETLRTSNLYVLFGLDILGCLMALFSFFSGISTVIKLLMNPLNVLKSVYPLFLIIDAMAIKFGNQIILTKESNLINEETY